MSTKKRGRPKTGNEVREAEVMFYLTREDAEKYAEFADKLGFVSRSSFFTAIMERLLIGGLAPVTFFRVGWQLGKLAAETGANKGAGFDFPFKPLPPFELREKPRPEPALPDGSMAPKEINKALRELKLQLQEPV